MVRLFYSPDAMNIFIHKGEKFRMRLKFGETKSSESIYTFLSRFQIAFFSKKSKIDCQKSFPHVCG